jgi:hypothetical protein
MVETLPSYILWAAKTPGELRFEFEAQNLSTKIFKKWAIFCAIFVRIFFPSSLTETGMGSFDAPTRPR